MLSLIKFATASSSNENYLLSISFIFRPGSLALRQRILANSVPRNAAKADGNMGPLSQRNHQPFILEDTVLEGVPLRRVKSIENN